jgi:hypothetical protein
LIAWNKKDNDVASISVIVDGLNAGNFSYYQEIGFVAHFGTDMPTRRWEPRTSTNIIITGPTGATVGWYLHFFAGSPSKFTLLPEQIPFGTCPSPPN